MKFKPRTFIVIAGFNWLIIGTFLLTLGIRFILHAAVDPSLTLLSRHFSALVFVSRFVANHQNGVVILLSFSLLLGFFKGRFVLKKTVQKHVQRILTFPSPSSITHLYTKAYYLLILCMIGLGISMRFIPITIDTRGVIDVAVGAALMNGAMLYFREAINYRYLKRKGA